MAQFTVHENKNPATRSFVPFLLDVQTDLLSDLETRVVVPLRPVLALKGKTRTEAEPRHGRFWTRPAAERTGSSGSAGPDGPITCVIYARRISVRTQKRPAGRQRSQERRPQPPSGFPRARLR
jgi:hypothetical protein